MSRPPPFGYAACSPPGPGRFGPYEDATWSDEHMGRPARMPQLRMSFAAIWDDILPPVPEAHWRASNAAVARALAAGD